MNKRKLQVILFGALLAFSATAQSQTAGINNTFLTQLARQYAAAAIGRYSTTSSTDYADLYYSFRDGLNVNSRASASNPPAGGALVVNGVVRNANSATSLIQVLYELARSPGFDPSTVTILDSASPNS